MVRRGLNRIPIWVRVPGIIALVLAAVLTGTTLLGAADVGDSHGGSGDGMEMSDHNGDAGDGGGQGGSGGEGGSDHDGDADGSSSHGDSGGEGETSDHR